MDNIVIILILFSIVSSIMKSITKKQAEQQKRKNQTVTPGQQTAQRPARQVSAQDKPMPAHAFVHATPPKPTQDRKSESEPSDEGYSTIQHRYEPADSTNGEGTSFNDLIPSWEAPAAVQSEEEQAPLLGLQFNSETLVKSVIFSEILKRPRAAFRSRV